MSRALAVALFVATLCTSGAAWALDAHKTAAALAARAAKAFESGDMTKAAGLYRDAFQIDATESAYLYGAARAAHTGHDLPHAAQDYEAFLARPDAEPARAQKAKAYLVALRAELSTQKATEAEQAVAGGDNLLGATLYLEAWRIAPDQPEPLLKAALLERKLTNKSAAIEHLKRYIEMVPAGAPGRGTAETLLAELTGVAQEKSVAAKPAAAPKSVVVVAPKPQPAAAPPPPKVAPAPAAALVDAGVASQPGGGTSSRKVVGWTVLGVGGAALIGAGILAIVASGQQSTLDGNLLPDGNFDGRKISVADAASAQSGINGKWTGVVVASGAGAAAVGVGVWLLATARADVAIVPRADGFSLAGRF